MIIGITGKTGSGKSTVCAILRDMGCFVCDADKIAHRVMEKGSPLLKKIADTFGKDTVDPYGNLDRAKLAERAFATKEATEKLNRLTHPAILEVSFKEIENAIDNGYKLCFYDAAALFESGADKKCDFTVCVQAPPEVRLERIMVRDGLTKEKALERMNAQKSDNYYSEKADFIIDNSPDKNLVQQVEKLVRQLGL